MTRTLQRQSSAQDQGLPRASENQTDNARPRNSSTSPRDASVSDNDAGEGPIREKLKKTSLATIPKYGVVPAADDALECEGKDETMSSQVAPETAQFLNKEATDNQTTNTSQPHRGRLDRKRSLEDLPHMDEHNGRGNNEVEEKSGGHTRKKSRDVKVGDLSQEASRRIGSSEAPVQEEASELLGEEDMNGSDKGDLETADMATPPPLKDESVDQDMPEAAFSPRKKRSRDAIDSETHREQKIAATDENRARKRSREDERQHPLTSKDIIGVPKETDSTAAASDIPANKANESEPNQIPESIALIEPAITSPSITLAASKSPEPNTQVSGVDPPKDLPQTSSSAFASSGFAALAKSSASPFGIIGGSSPFSGNSFGSAGPTQTKVSSFGPAAVDKTVTATTNSFGATEFRSSSGFGSAGTSHAGFSFGSLGTSVFGGGVGGGFGGPFGEGAQLNSFAVNGGDAKLGSNGPTSVFGASSKADDGEENDDEENDEISGDEKKEDAAEPADERFHEQNMETGEEDEDTVFAVRGKLFMFDGAWKERGVGLFKLNVTDVPTEDGEPSKKTARFIMRAMQVFRLMLNTPVFREMSIGTAEGEEPTGRQISFSVVEEGKAIPYMLRVAKDNDAKKLYHEVRQLQKHL